MTIYIDRAREAIRAERERQIGAEGFTGEHDDQWVNDELSRAARAYQGHAVNARPSQDMLPTRWPWHYRRWKPGTVERNLVRAGALYQAELDRIKRRDRLTRRLNNDAEMAQGQVDHVVNLLAMLYRDRDEQVIISGEPGPITLVGPGEIDADSAPAH